MPENGTPGLTWRGLETGLRSALCGHEEGNLGNSQELLLRITAPFLDPTRAGASGNGRSYRERCLDARDEHRTSS